MRMTLDEATRILLRGTTGCTALTVARATGLHHESVNAYVQAKYRSTRDDTLEKIYLFVWRQLNAHLLIDAEPLAAPRSPVCDATTTEPAPTTG
jgi:hypothetical protein